MNTHGPHVLLLTGMYPSPDLPRNGVAVQRQMDSLRREGVTFELFHLRSAERGSFVSTLRQFRQMAQPGMFDFVHLHYGVKTTILAQFSSIPVIATYHGTDVNGWNWTGGQSFYKPIAFNLAAAIVRCLSRKFARVIVMTMEMKQRLPASVRNRTHIIPMGVDTELFRPMAKPEARQRLGWGNERVVLFSNNNSEMIKRQDLAEAAVMHLQTVERETRLVVLQGTSPEDVPVYMAAADCLLVTSDKEGAPNIVREALCCRLPVVSVPVGDIPAVLAAFPGTGIIVDRAPAAIAEGIRNAFSLSFPDDHMRIVAELSLQAAATKVLDVYRSMLKRSNV